MNFTLQGLFDKLFSLNSIGKTSSVQHSNNKVRTDMNSSVIPDTRSQDVREEKPQGTYEDLNTAMKDVAKEIKQATSPRVHTVKTENEDVEAEIDPTPAKKAATNSYTIKPGDNLATIAYKNKGITIQMLMDANPGINPRALRIGQKINLPQTEQKPEVKVKVQEKPNTPVETAKSTEESKSTQQKEPTVKITQTYVVKSGDNLSKIAAKYGLEASDLMSANNLKSATINVGQKINIPDVQVTIAKKAEAKEKTLASKTYKANMQVDASKKEEYKKSIVKMMNAKGFKDTAEQEILANAIINKSIDMKIDPVLVASIINQEVDFCYKSDNIWGVNGKGVMQLTKSTIDDIYRGRKEGWYPSYYESCNKELKEIFKKYPTSTDLYNAIKKKDNYELNMEVGIIILKGKLETSKGNIGTAVYNYNGNVKPYGKNPKIQVRDHYKTNVMAYYNTNKLS